MLGFLYSVGQVKKKQPRSLRSPFSISLSLYREFFPRLSYRTYILISLFRALIPSLSLLLPLSHSFSLARYAPPLQPATHDPPSLPQPPRPSPRHSNNATQPRPPSYLLLHLLLLLLPPLPSPSLRPSSPSPRKRGIASNSNYWTRGYHASNLTLRHDVDTTLYHFLRGIENTVDDVKISRTDRGYRFLKIRLSKETMEHDTKNPWYSFALSSEIDRWKRINELLFMIFF